MDGVSRKRDLILRKDGRELTDGEGIPPLNKKARRNADSALKPEALSPLIPKIEHASKQPSEEYNYTILSRKVMNAMDALNKIEDFGRGEASTSLKEIDEIYEILREENIEDLKKLCNAMIKKGLLEEFVRIWDFSHQNTEEIYPETDGAEFTDLYNAKVVLLNYSDACEELAKAFYENDEVIKRLVRELKIGIPYQQQPATRKMIDITLGILYNVVRRESRNRVYIRKDNGIDTILAYGNSPYEEIKAQVFILVAYCISEHENEKIMAERGVIIFIVNLLSSSLKDNSRAGGFSLEEIIAALNKLASNDANKVKIVEAGVLPLLVKALGTSETRSPSERMAAVDCVWTLSFHDTNKQKIIEEPGLLSSVKGLRSEIERDAKKTDPCSSIMFVLGLEKPREEHSRDKHIMISYNWDVQSKMLELRDMLQQSGYNIWMDVDKMHGSVLSAMANAVENSALVLVAMTESYRYSNACRTEGEYAYKRGVPILPLRLQSGYKPDDWLGALIGAKLYVDLSDGELNTRIDEVKKQIEFLTKSDVPAVTSGKENPHGDSRQQPSRMPIQPISKTSLDGVSLAELVISCENWTVDEVRNWYHGIGLEDNSWLMDYNGIALSQLCKWLLRSPKSYYDLLREEMKCPIKDTLIFTAALESLLRS